VVEEKAVEATLEKTVDLVLTPAVQDDLVRTQVDPNGLALIRVVQDDLVLNRVDPSGLDLIRANQDDLDLIRVYPNGLVLIPMGRSGHDQAVISLSILIKPYLGVL
jgi:hypothetical protein